MPPQNKIPFAVSHPEVLSWWSTNNVLNPMEIISGSRKKALWVCELGHEWEASVIHIVERNQRCPYCSGHRVLSGFNDLGTLRSDISSEWHPTKNLDLTPEMVTLGSNKKVWWLGKDCGHEWISMITNRVRLGHGCAVCRGYQTQVGVNDLTTTHPKIALEWHPIKNTEAISNITAGSKKKVWWLGKDCGHEWEATVHHRANDRDCPYCSGKKILSGFNDLVTTHPKLAEQWSLVNDKKPTEVSLGSEYFATWNCAKGHEWKAVVYSRTGGRGCPICANEQTCSVDEQMIANYIETLGLTVKRNQRNIIRNELDIYVPEKKIAIEYNGLYWHSESAGKSSNYHHDKWRACQDKGIQLIQIWEDEWNRDPELVKSMLAHKLGVSQQRKVSGHKTEVIELTNEQCTVFLNANHIQGAVGGGVRLGLVEKSAPDKVLAVMVLKSEPGSDDKVLNLLRFATSVTVVGGFTKLLKYAERNFKPDSIITFSDNCVSDGGLYRNNGFVAVKELEPDYKYVVKNERIHKFRYRLKRFKEDPALQYEEGLSERELALLNRIPRIWDAGKTKWSKNVA